MISLFFVSFWLLGLCVAALTVVWFHLRRRGAADSIPRCGRCGYNLTGSTGNRCPECGGLFIESGVVVRSRSAVAARRAVLVSLGAFTLVALFGVAATVISVSAARRAKEAAIAAELRAQLAAQRAAQAQAVAQHAVSTSQPAPVDARGNP